MSTRPGLDCIVIGHNEPPFEEYESLIRQYGEDSEAYRDLKLSFVDMGEGKLTYVDLMNWAFTQAHGRDPRLRSGDIPSLAAAYLVNFLRRRGFHADFINLFQDEKDRLSALLGEDPLCVAIATTLYVVNFPVHEMVEFIRAHNPAVKIVVGGPLIANHFRNYAGDGLAAALADIGADFYVVEGQGELTLSHLVGCLRNGGDLRTVPNLLYFEDGRLLQSGPAGENNSLDENSIDWLQLSTGDLGATLQTRTARSCAFKCAFCNYPTRAGKLTLAGLDTIRRELDSMQARGNVENVVFIDDTFNVPLPRFKDICRLMIERQYNLQWFSYFRCSNADEEAIDLMARSGCKGVFLGIESGSPQILKNMDKSANIDQYRRGIRWLHDHGILTFGSFIVGFPGETAATVDETRAFIAENKPHFYRTQMWYNEPGTPIHDRHEKYSITGEGFVWSHSTMESLEAMDHIDRIFLTVEDSIWLPQWSYDFWILPYLYGRGITPDQVRSFTAEARKLMALGIASVPAAEKAQRRNESLRRLTGMASDWKLAR